MKRRFDPAEPELMDRPQPVSAELERDLYNLRQLNRFFGSYRLVRHFLRRWLNPGDRWRMADLATGSGDIPRLAVDYARSIGAAIAVYFLTATIFREPMTRYDGQLSAARAFSFSELRTLAQRAGWKNFGHRKFHFARQAIWLEDL